MGAHVFCSTAGIKNIHGICKCFHSTWLHIYKDIWDAEIDSELLCLWQPNNREDHYPMVVMNGTVSNGSCECKQHTEFRELFSKNSRFEELIFEAQRERPL